MPSKADLVERIFNQTFGLHEDSLDLRMLLDTVGDPPSPRVQLAVLKLSEGDPEKFKQNVEVARIDYRDVLAYAEYPGEMRTHPSKQGLKPGELGEIRRRDREQYEAWLASFE